MKETIQAALAKLDAKNDNHWTQDGLPRLETVRLLASLPSLTREQLTDAAPDFTRVTAAAPVPVPPAVPKAVPAASVLAAEEAKVAEAQEDDLEAKFAASEQALDKAREALHLAQQAHADQQARSDKLRMAIEDRQPPEHIRNTHSMREYLEAQSRDMQERGNAWKKLEDSGVTLADIIPQRAPIDAARMVRSRGGRFG